MQCPVDQTVLQMTDRQGVEIDYCPKCRGVWLDRGELDKIIAKSETQAVPAARPAPAPSPGPDPRSGTAGYPPPPTAYPPQSGYQQYPPRYPSSPDSPDYRGGYGHGHDPRYGRKRRKESFLGDLFDF